VAVAADEPVAEPSATETNKDDHVTESVAKDDDEPEPEPVLDRRQHDSDEEGTVVGCDGVLLVSNPV